MFNFLKDDNTFEIIVCIISFMVGWILGDIFFHNYLQFKQEIENSGVLSNYDYMQVENEI